MKKVQYLLVVSQVKRLWKFGESGSVGIDGALEEAHALCGIAASPFACRLFMLIGSIEKFVLSLGLLSRRQVHARIWSRKREQKVGDADTTFVL